MMNHYIDSLELALGELTRRYNRAKKKRDRATYRLAIVVLREALEEVREKQKKGVTK